MDVVFPHLKFPPFLAVQGNPGGNFLVTRPTTRLKDLAGIDSILQQIKELVFFPTMFPELYSHLGVSPPCGILLNGPSGCGKTMLASAIAGELGLPFYKVSTTIYSCFWGCLCWFLCCTLSEVCHDPSYSFCSQFILLLRHRALSWWAAPLASPRNASGRSLRAPPPMLPPCCSSTPST